MIPLNCGIFRFPCYVIKPLKRIGFELTSKKPSLQ